jgi:hypothetical protein
MVFRSSRDLTQCTRTSVQTFLYDHCWEQVVSSYMLRFPRHPRMPVVIGTQLLSDQIDSQSKVRNLVRRCTIDIEAPG